MKQGQFSQEQIVAILQQAEKGEITIEALCRDKGITHSRQENKNGASRNLCWSREWRHVCET